ncbi:hypothetical protein C4K04_3388 [Pseudomonas chlororaphis]|uniref:YD repeat-containing protein n=1 Tax=Pseudomonas chlororaphis TaxID=587753 RepID=A0A3G7TPT5_9PSED|nr:hypothetical protein [Pseudomonas chlororaphis]AZE49060.1 hypothetical protein C4K04_3388 [Pseudomonas chlororaphis]
MATPYHGLFSEALNSQSLVTGVSPQTGAFQACLTMAEIEIGTQNPVSFSLNLSIGMNANIKISLFLGGIGGSSAPQVQKPLIGASFNIPFFSYRDLKWFTASGASEIIGFNELEKVIWLVYHKTKDITIEPVITNDWKGQMVKHKDGTVEFYNYVYEKDTSNLLYSFLIRRMSPAGHVLEFSYDKFWRVIKIKDNNSDNHIAIDYGDPSGDGSGMTYTVTQATYGQTFVSKIALAEYTGKGIFSDNYYLINSVTLPNRTEEKYYFGYASPGYSGEWDPPGEDGREFVLSKVITPYGLTQQADYTTLDYGYVDSVLKTVPVVRALFVTDIGNANSVIRGKPYATSYQFKTKENLNNYTGYTPNTAVTPGRDVCIYKTDNYEYSTTEVHGASDVEVGDKSGIFDKKIVRTYNRFHLLIKEQVFYRDRGSLSEVIRTYTYPVIAGDITVQPANFQFWEKCTTEYVMDSLEINQETGVVKTQTQQFDECGNLLATTAESGISQTYEYYAVAGELGCPPALNGIKQHVKSIETKPKVTLPEPVPPLANKRQEFTYARVDGFQYLNLSPYMVLLKDTKVKTATGMLTLSTCNYYDTREPRILIGALKSVETISPAVAQGGSAVEIKNWTEYSWAVIDEKNIKKTTVDHATAAGSSVPSIQGGSVESRLADGLLVKETSANNVETTYEYNNFSQLTRKTYFSNKLDYKEVEEFDFQFPKQYKVYGIKNLVTYKKVRSNGVDDTSIYFRYYLGASFQVCVISQGKFTEGQNPADPNDPEYLVAKRNMYKSDGVQIGESLSDQAPGLDGVLKGIDIITFMEAASNFSSTISPIGVEYLDTINPRENISTNGVVGAPICYSQKINDYGSIDEVRVTTIGVNNSPIVSTPAPLLVNTYDGFGRVTSAGQIAKGFVNYVYDELDRVAKEKEVTGLEKHGVQTTAYEYSSHIPSMALPVSLKCTVDDESSDSALMDAKREYDAFSRLTKQTTPNIYSRSVFTELYEYTDQNFPYLPTKLTKDAGYVTFSYDDCTGMLLKKTLNNGSGSGQPPGLVVDFVYDKKTKLLQSSTIGQTSTESQSRYDYTYDRFDRISKVKALFEGDASSYVTTYRYSSLLDFPVSWDIYAGAGSLSFPLWECEYGYDSVGRVSSILYKPYDGGRLLATIDITIKYVNSTKGFASGNVELIELSSLEFSPGLKSLRVDFSYDERGLEKQRSYSFLEKGGNVEHSDARFIVGNLIDENQLISTKQTIKYAKREGKGEFNVASKQYRYTDSGGGTLSASTSIQHDDGTTPGSTKEVLQQVAGNSKIDRLSTLIDNTYTEQIKYTYNSDRVQLIAPLPGYTIQPSAYEYDDNGNVNKDPSFNFLRYNVENALSTYAQTNFTPMRETKYYYSPSGELNRIKDPDGESVYYFYNDNTLAGEVSPKLRIFYIQVGEILLGRVLVYPASSTSVNASYELEIFGTDSAGSVRAVYRFTAGATEPVVNYYDYSDYGERTPS